MRRGLTTYCGSLSRETRSGAGRRPRFALSGENPLPGEASRADRKKIRLRELPAWAAETGRHAGVKDGSRAVLPLFGADVPVPTSWEVALPANGASRDLPGSGASTSATATTAKRPQFCF
jgi:hypothetical protein